MKTARYFGVSAFLFFWVGFCFCAEDISQLINEGNKLIREKKYPEAEAVLFRAKTIDGKSALPDISLGMMFLQREDLTRAELHLRAAETLSPSMASIQYTLALLYEKKSENGMAVSYWRKLLNDPNFKDTAKKHIQFLEEKK